MTRAEVIRFLILRSLGNFLILLALYGVAMTFGPAIMYQIKYELIQIRGVTFTVISDRYKKPGTTFETLRKSPGFSDVLAGDKEQIMIPIDTLFSVLIPKLGIDEKVVANVDPNNPDAYLPVLQYAVAHAKGSVFPGDPGSVYLFAHSADNWWDIEHYNAIFYTLNNLSSGDEVDIFFENRRYTYVVSQKLISDPQDTSLLTGKHEGPQQLILQTCWPPGTTFKRLYIIAKPKNV